MPMTNFPAEIEEFLYFDPDTGMTVCMIMDGDGFRPAHAADEFRSIELAAIHANSPPASTVLAARTTPQEESAFYELFVSSYEHAYGAPTMS